ncbi:MAG TPA: hypothetical protein VJU84_02745 [Pyrinomonadaceae bacterium]|nr:hypothetical protein [Pyrinomonadaceae bacterium]
MPDYWKWSKERLTKQAEKYNIPTEAVRENKEWAEPFFNRSGIIATLVARDAHRRGSWTLLIAIIAILISFGALTVSYFTYRLKYNETWQTPPSQTVPTIEPEK